MWLRDSNPKAGWTERTLVHHVGRWVRGKAGQAKFSDCAIQNSRFTLVNNTELYDLKTDPGETKNLATAMPDKVAEMQAMLEKLITDGRSTPGAAQKNDVEVRRYPSGSASTPKKRKK